MTQVEAKVEGAEPTDQAISWQYCGKRFDMKILHDAGIDQGGFGAAEQLKVQANS